MITIKEFTDSESICEMARIILDKKLYVSPAWLLAGVLNRATVQGTASIEHMVVAYKDDEPVGVAIREPKSWQGKMMQVFVKEEERHQNIGRQLIGRIKEEDVYAGLGIDKTGAFWEHMEVRVW